MEKNSRNGVEGICNGKSAMLVECGYKDELKYIKHKRGSSSLEATILGTIASSHVQALSFYHYLCFFWEPEPVC